MVIGLNLDDVIVCYDQAMNLAAEAEGYIQLNWDRGVMSLRNFLLSKKDGEARWQKIRAKSFGVYIEHAIFQPGFPEFVRLARAGGHRLAVFSIKPDVSPLDEAGILLRVAAIRWLDCQGFFTRLGFSFRDLHFCSNEDEMCRLIAHTQCCLFLGNQISVFNNPLFPEKTRSGVFAPETNQDVSAIFKAFTNWREVSEAEFGFTFSNQNVLN